MADVSVEGKAQHDLAAKMVQDMFNNQMAHAQQIGKHAFGMGLRRNACPFKDTVLSAAWLRGWYAAQEASDA